MPQILTGFATGGAAQLAGIDPPYYLSDPRFSILAQTDLSTFREVISSLSKSISANGSVPQLDDQFKHCLSSTRAQHIVTRAMKSQVATVLQTVDAEIGEMRPLHNYGVDSLVGIEICNWLYRETGVQMGMVELLGSRPIVELASDIAEKSRFVFRKNEK